MAALNLANLDEGWEARLAVNSPYRRLSNVPPVAVAGRIVWHMVVYDPATGRSTPTPSVIRESQKGNTDPTGVVPSMLAVGDQVTLTSYAFDPITGKATAIPYVPASSGLGGAAAWTGGPRGILGFGGMVSAAGVATTTNSAVRLLPAS